MTIDIERPVSLQGENAFAQELAHLKILVVKVTHRRNLKCAYCYEHITGGPDMAFATFQRLVDVSLPNTRSSRFTFLFHGGEPTLAKTDWYRAAMDYADAQARQRSIVCDYSMQSNFNYVPDDLLALLVERKVGVGVSVDGPPEINDQSRGGSSRAIHNFRTARDAGLEVGILTTISSANWDSMPAIVDWLQNDLGVFHFKANVAYPVGVGLHLKPLDREQIVVARKALLDHMLDTRGEGVVEDNLLNEILRFYANSTADNRTHTLCDDIVCGAGTTVLGVTPSGDLLPCGRFEWNDKQWKLGSIWSAEKPASESPRVRLKRFMGVAQQNWAECAGCRAKNVCSYGCQAFIVRTKEKRNIECEPTLWLFDYLTSRKDDVTAFVENYTRHRQLPPSETNYNDIYHDEIGTYKDSYRDRGVTPRVIHPNGLNYNDIYHDEIGTYKDSYRDRGRES